MSHAAQFYIDGQWVEPSSTIGFDVIKVVGQRLVKFRRLGLHCDSQRVFLLLIAETSPGGGGFRKNHRPVIFVGNHVQPVRSLVEELALDGSGSVKVMVVFSFAPARQTFP